MRPRPARSTAETGALGHLAMRSAGLIVESHPPPRSNHRTPRKRVERDALIAAVPDSLPLP